MEPLGKPATKNMTDWLLSTIHAPTSLRDLGSPATIDDVADFVVDYMVSDILGVVCTRLMHSRRIPSTVSRISLTVLLIAGLFSRR